MSTQITSFSFLRRKSALLHHLSSAQLYSAPTNTAEISSGLLYYLSSLPVLHSMKRSPLIMLTVCGESSADVCYNCVQYTACKVTIFGVILVAFSRIRTEYGKIRENADQNNSKYEHFLRSDIFPFQ